MSKTVGVAMIVKNEEALLARCLESVKGFPIYILDTGSVDRTIEIALRYTKNVYIDYIWTDNFSEAQNLIKSRVKEDFILSIDADEVLLTGIESVIEAAQLAKDVVRVQMVAEGAIVEAKNDFGFGRLFRNTPDIFWCQPIHKHLNVPGEGERVGDVKISYGWSPAHLNDPDRSLRMLEQAVATQPDSARNHYYLGREYLYKNQWQNCIDTLKKYIKLSEWPSEMAEAYMEIGQAHEHLGQYQEAADMYLQAIKINANFKEAIQCLSKIVTAENAIQWKRMAKFANNHDVLWNRVPVEPASDIIFLEPHQDDAFLYGFYTLLRLKPLLISVTSSFIQPERGDVGCDAETRNNETIEAAKIAGCPVVFLNIKDTELTEETIRERLKGFNPEKAYIPAQHDNGNPQHNLIGKVALELFGKDKCEQYCTYVRGDFNIVKGSFEVKPVHNEAELKNKALDCFRSQLALPSTAPHFAAVRGKSEWLA
jgi:glycosyltransferase involved in cell wall biosynthesis